MHVRVKIQIPNIRVGGQTNDHVLDLYTNSAAKVMINWLEIIVNKGLFLSKVLELFFIFIVTTSV